MDQSHLGDFPEANAELTKLGASLLEVLHTWQAKKLKNWMVRFETTDNFGFGSVDSGDIKKAQARVHAVEALQREVTALSATNA